MPPKSSRWVSLEAQIFQLILQDLMGKAVPPPFSTADGLAAWCLGQGEGPFLSRELGMIVGHLGRKIKKRKKGVGSLPTQSHQPFSVLRSLTLKG